MNTTDHSPVQRVLERFGQIETFFEHAVSISEQKFHALKTKDFQTVDELNKREMEEAVKRQEQFSLLKDDIVHACRHFGAKEENISHLIPFATKDEAEALKDFQKRAFHFEQKLENNTKMNQCLVEAMLDCSQSIVDTWAHVAAQEKQNNTFFNKKL